MELEVFQSKVEGRIEAPSSKSYTHRALAISLLAKGRGKIRQPLLAEDTKATLSACRVLGAKVEEGEVCEVEGTGGRLKPTSQLIDAANSGTTMRFMTAICSLSPVPIRLVGDESLSRRPMGPLVEALRALGVRARCEGKDGRPPVVVEGGGLRGGEVEIEGGTSSQFISALLLACPYAERDVGITVTGTVRSRPYIEMTLKLLDMSGARIKRSGDLANYEIEGGQVFRPLEVRIPGDFSSAAFPLGAAALTGKVRVENLNLEDPQGDKRIVSLLEEFGAEVRTGEGWVEVSKGGLNAIEVDCADNPDLVPILAVLGSVADGVTRISGVPHLRFKETDRLAVLTRELSKMGARITELEDGLKITGVRELRGARLNSFGDHRMAMAFAVAGLVARGKTVVEGSECIPVSYPTFVADMRLIGANLREIGSGTAG
ncbi:MAG: 3-phosphoshikimate 1-carboxyvinyltransferase [Candidatus Hadarchaeales archaeon]